MPLVSPHPVKKAREGLVEKLIPHGWQKAHMLPESPRSDGHVGFTQDLIQALQQQLEGLREEANEEVKQAEEVLHLDDELGEIGPSEPRESVDVMRRRGIERC